MSRFRMVALGAALVFGVSATAQAQAGTAGRPGQRGAQMREVTAGPLFRGITLSDAQKAQLRTVGEKYATLRQEMRKDGRGVKGAGERQRPDSATRARMGELVQRQQTDLRAVLTAEQQKTFDQNVAQLRDRVGQRGNGEGRQRGRAGRVGRGA
jgi:Spy/CpxP family protein refolding chaperone